MGALRQPRSIPTDIRKGPAQETSLVDKFGRDSDSPCERLRATAGYGPLFHSMMADLPRLLGPSAVAWPFVMTVLRLSLGRPHERSDGKGSRHDWTLPISTRELAELCWCNIRDIERQLKDLAERKIIGVKVAKSGGGVRYAISLRTVDWQGLEDYAVWRRRQTVVEMPEPDDDPEEDTELVPVSSEAVAVLKKPATVRPGRATRAAAVTVGIREMVFQNHSPNVDAVFNAVIQSGKLIVSATFLRGESEAKGEDKENAGRHPCRTVPSNVGSDQVNTPPTAAALARLFDPLLQKSGSRLLSPDSKSLKAACVAMGAMPFSALEYFVLNPKGRSKRTISGPPAVASIVQEARANWEAGQRDHGAAAVPHCSRCGADTSQTGSVGDICLGCAASEL